MHSKPCGDTAPTLRAFHLAFLALFFCCSPLSAQEAGAEEEPIRQTAEQMPTFPGGIEACVWWMANNLQYPEDAFEEGVEGSLLVQFVVEKDGSRSGITVINPLTPSLNAEAVRLIEAMPQWEAGSDEGVAVRVQCSLPIQFKLTAQQQKERELVLKAKDEAEQRRIQEEKAREEEAERQRMAALRAHALDSVPLLRFLRKTATQTEADATLFSYTVLLDEGRVKILANASKSTSVAYAAFWQGTNQLLTPAGSKRNVARLNAATSEGYWLNFSNTYAEFDNKASSTYHFYGKTTTWGAIEHSDDFLVKLQGYEDDFTLEMMDSLQAAVEKNLRYFIDDIFRTTDRSTIVIKPLVPTPQPEEYDYLSTYMNGQGAESLGFQATREGKEGRWYIPHLQNDWKSDLPLYEITVNRVGLPTRRRYATRPRNMATM